MIEKPPFFLRLDVIRGERTATALGEVWVVEVDGDRDTWLH
jgi:hypothetical protein